MKTHTSLTVAISASLAFTGGADTPPGATFDAPWIGYDTATYPEGLWPVASDIGDFNGDGAKDLAAVSWGGTPYLSILFGDGEGRYLPPVLYAIDLESLDIVARDFDNDGDIDLAIAESGRFWEGLYVSLWFNDGEGGFTRRGLYATGDDGPSGITAADFNDDGFIDVAVAHDEYIESDNTVAILLNSNGAGFGSPQVVTISSGTNDLDSGDVDGDGDPDLVVAHEGNFWSIVRNDGGTFVSGGNVIGIESGSIPENPVVTLADVDLDNDLDVLFSNQASGGFGSGAVGLWRNNGSGGFGQGESISLLTPEDPYTNGGVDIDVADVTHDGWPDLLISNGHWFLIAGNGEGGFANPRLFHAGDMHDHRPAIDLEASDQDNDGDLDVIVLANGSLEACVYLNPGRGEFIQPDPISMVDPVYAPAFPVDLCVDDIDDDGDLDLVSGYRSDFSERHGLTLRKNNGDGTFGPLVEMLEPTYPLDLVLRDMNNDGHEDILYVLNEGRFYIRLNDGNGGFGTRLARHVFGGQIGQIDAIDVDNDDDLDVIVDGGFFITISKNLGGNNYASPTRQDIGSYYEHFGYGDFNNDGNVDLLTDSGIQGYPQVSFGNGDGTFQAALTVPTGRDVQAFATADLDKDGNLDFASFYNLDEMGLGVRRGRGQGSFFPSFKMPGAYHFGDHTSSLDLTDADADTEWDAVTGSFGGQDFAFWRGIGDGTFEPDIRYGVGWNVHDVEPGDFDGDGNIDVAAICQVDNGRWFYAGVVIIRGLDPSGGETEPAQLTDVMVVEGDHVSGGVLELMTSDDQYYETAHHITGEAAEAHRLQYLLVAETNLTTGNGVTIRFEGKTGDPASIVTIFLRDWSGTYEQVAQFSQGLGDTVEVFDVANAAQYIRATDGRIDMLVKKHVVLPSALAGTPSFDDQIEIGVRE